MKKRSTLNGHVLVVYIMVKFKCSTLLDSYSGEEKVNLLTGADEPIAGVVCVQHHKLCSSHRVWLAGSYRVTELQHYRVTELQSYSDSYRVTGLQ